MTFGNDCTTASHFRCRKKLSPLLLALLLSLAVLGSSTQAATLITDKEDYPPGDSVIITGNGFWASETVTLQVGHADGDTTCTAGTTPWNVVADGAGSFTTFWIVPEACVDETLLVVADGLSSGLQASAIFTDASTKLTTSFNFSGSICIDTLTSSDSVVFCATLVQQCGGGGSAPLAGRAIHFFYNPGNCGVNVGQTADTIVYTDANGLACAVYYGADTLFPVTGNFSFRAKFLGEAKPGGGDPPNSACNPGSKVKLSASNKCKTFNAITGCDTNSPPVATCPGDTCLFVCDLSQVCIDGFDATDVDNNIESIVVLGGSLSGNSVCFTPVHGENVITFIVTDSSGEADTCQTIVTIMDGSSGLSDSWEAQSIAGDLDPPEYGLRLDGFFDNDPNHEVTFGFDDVRFDEYNAGFGRLHGTISVVEYDNTGGPGAYASSWAMNVFFDLIPDSIAVGTIPGYVSGYRYYNIKPDCAVEMINLTDPDDFANLWKYPFDSTKPFQVGDGANGKNSNFGASGWLTYLHDDNGTLYGDSTVHYTASDFLMDLVPAVDCPEDTTLSVDCNEEICLPGFTSTMDTFYVEPGGLFSLSGDTVCFTPSASGSYSIYFIGEDSCGNADTCVTVVDVTVAPCNVPPICLLPPADTTIFLCSIEQVCLVTTATDPDNNLVGCSITSGPGSIVDDTLWCYTPTGNETVNVEITCIDSLGETCVGTFSVTFEIDATPPSITCPADISVQCLADVPAPDTNLVVVSDNCPNPVSRVHVSDSSDGQSCPETIYRTYKATDAAGNEATCVQTIIVNDTTAPVLANCPADVTVQCDNIPAAGSPTATDNCDPNPTINYLGETITPGACANSYTITRSWEAVDVCGNADTCSQDIDVVDTSAPVLSGCPNDTTLTWGDSVPAPASVSASDNCDTMVTITFSADTVVAACLDSITRKWVAEDACGNKDSCMQLIIVPNDNQAPSFVDCPADVTVECDAVPSAANPSATDNCDANPVVVYLGQDSTAGACPQAYTLTRTWTATDACGNADTCVQVVTVVDTTPPVLADCPADVTVECDAIPTPGTPTATDNCSADNDITINYLGETVMAGACPQSYTLTRSWEAIDECGNADTCEQVIDVVDTTAPSFVDCPADVTVECDNIPAVGSPTATDNCDPNPTINYLGETSTPGACPNAYTLTRSWEAIDACGNADTCSQDIEVVDTTPPVLADCPADVTVECHNIPAVGSPTATDNCDPNPVINYLGESTTAGACANSYTLTRSWEAVDACGNADTCEQTIDVVDTTAPSFVDCPADATVDCDNIPAPATPSATDNCDPNPVVNYLGETVNPGNCPYTITRSWEAIDDCGNADTCTQTLTVIDNVAPSFVDCPADESASCDNVPAPASPTATDNCDSNPSVNYLGESSTPGACANSYTLTRRWVATDICGNADTCTQIIDVADTTKPMCSVPNDTTIYLCDTGTVCFAVGATDNCDSVPTCSQIAGGGSYSNGMWCYAAMAGTEDVQAIFECTDACGNVCIDTINVHFVVNAPPQISVNVNSPVVLCEAGDTVCVSYSATDPDNGVTVQTQIGWAAGGMACFIADTSGTYCNTLTATDSCGLTDDTTYCVVVEICAPPTLGADSTKDFGFVCAPVSGSFKLRNFSSGCGPYNWTVNGNAASQDTTILYSAGVCASLDQTWAIAVTDGCGRTDSYSVTIRADVNCPPQASCPGLLPEIRVCSLGTVVCIQGDEFDCSDQDGNESSTTLNGQPYNPGDSYCFTANTAGLQSFTLICTDACGAADTCNVSVNIVVDPSICPSGCAAISIEKVHNTIQGQYENVALTIDSMPYAIGGFDILIEYDASALSLSTVTPGSFITSCGWEYFTYRYGAAGNCGNNACPSGKLRIIGVAEINNGANHPLCFQATPAHLADLTFLVTNDRTFECQYVPIRFCWYDCGDNTVSSPDGDTLYISSNVYNYFDGVNWTDVTNIAAPFPSPFGANTSCDIDLGDGKPDPIRCISFYNGGIDIVCADSIDDRGDVNMNGIANEVSDAVLLGNYFIYGISVFTINIEGQIAASDVNADGAVLSVADLVYLIRIIIGDAAAYSKVTVPVNVSMAQSPEGILTIEDRTDIGAAFILVAGQVEPLLLAGQMDMDYNYDGAHTRILVWSTAGNNFTGDFIQVDGEVVSVEMATSEGNPVALNTIPSDFTLNQNYPNPFNPTTVISFSLPIATSYELTIFNLNGQQVSSFTGASESAGMIEVEWEAGDFASGIYFYKLQAGEFSEIKKMVLIK